VLLPPTASASLSLASLIIEVVLVHAFRPFEPPAIAPFGVDVDQTAIGVQITL
jgi:hypothetical protein